MAITLTINGTPTTLDAEGDMPLLWALRDLEGLTGTKFGCGAGHCGACTVHMDGEAARACSVTLEEAAGRSIVTIEGVTGTTAQKVQDAWLRHQVAQCGYCQPGQIMTAIALLEAGYGDDETVEAVMSGNLCRCATYLRIRAAVLDAAA